MVVQRGVYTTNKWWVKGENVGHEHGYQLDAALREAGANTLPLVVQFAADKYGDAPLMGTRKLHERQKKSEEGRTIEKLRLGEYEWRTYREVFEQTVEAGLGIRTLGAKAGERIVILAETRAEWFTSALGCLHQNITVVTLYTNLTDEGIAHGINETEVSIAITSHDVLPRLLRITSQCPKLKQLIVIEDQLEGIGKDLKVPDGITLTPYNELLQAGRARGRSDDDISPNPTDVAIIMYTSGSTGTPKGVQISHTNIMTSIIAWAIQANLKPGDRYLAYLPLAHVMELATEISLTAMGVTIAYSSPLTLFNTSPKIMEKTVGDTQVAKPTAFNAVPLILDRLVKGVSSGVEKQGVLMNTIFKGALRCKQKYPNAGWLFDLIVFKKVQAQVGGKLRMVVVGGAPLSPQTHKAICTLFGCTLQIGYGTTETSACVTSTDCDDTRTGHVGPPNHGVLVRLEDWEEGGYRVTDSPRPRGEIVVGGPSVVRGYFKQPEETKAAFFETSDGVRWFRTGDIGEFDETGVLKIIDRKKDLVKLKHGEYVSLGSTEYKLKTLPVIDNICVYADSTQDRTVAIIVPSAEPLSKLASSIGVEETKDLAVLCDNEAVRDALLAEIQTHSRKSGVHKTEIPARIHLTPEPWTPENGLVTAAFKLRRKQIQQRFQSAFDNMYATL